MNVVSDQVLGEGATPPEAGQDVHDISILGPVVGQASSEACNGPGSSVGPSSKLGMDFRVDSGTGNEEHCRPDGSEAVIVEAKRFRLRSKTRDPSPQTQPLGLTPQDKPLTRMEELFTRRFGEEAGKRYRLQGMTLGNEPHRATPKNIALQPVPQPSSSRENGKRTLEVSPFLGS